MDCSLLPEGRVSKGWHPGLEGLATILPAHLRVLREEYKSWTDGRLLSILFSTVWMIHCNQSLLLVLPTVSQIVMEEVKTDSNDSNAEVHNCNLRQVEFLQMLQGVHPWLDFFGVGADWSSSHLRSWVMMVPRKQKDTTVWCHTGWWGWVGLGSFCNPHSAPLS